MFSTAPVATFNNARWDGAVVIVRSLRHMVSCLSQLEQDAATLTICSYAEVPKYRCPRCTTRTCSLPCYKRHQQRAACSGKRDPAAYLKKSQLATAASVDRDYNYLKGIEKSIDDASVDARERGVGSGLHSGDAQGRHFKREGAFQRYLTENKIAVEYAPKGMSRQKGNRSRVTKNDKIYWTVEWRDQSGERDLRHDAEHTTSLRDLYRGVQAIKRKRQATVSDAQNSDSGSRKKPRRDESNIPSQRQNEATEQGELNASSASASRISPHIQELDTYERDNHHFYLRQHSTAGSSVVVHPVDPDSTLTEALQCQTVQEYPTIFVLREPPDRLPDGYIAAEDYRAKLQGIGKEQQVPGASNLRHPAQTSSRRTNTPQVEGELDAKAILDMLKRDVRA